MRRDTLIRSYQLLSARDRKKYLFLLVLRASLTAFDVTGLAGVALISVMVASRLSGTDSIEVYGLELDISVNYVFLVTASVVTGLFIAKSFLSALLQRKTTSFLARCEGEAARSVLAKVFSGNLDELESSSRGELVWSVTTSSLHAITTILGTFSTLVAEGALFLGLFAFFLFINSPAALGVVGYFVLLFILYQAFAGERMKEMGKDLVRKSSALTDSIIGLVGVFRESKASGAIPTLLRPIENLRTEQAFLGANLRFLSSLPRVFVESALLLGMLILTLWQFSIGTLESGLATVAVFLAGGVRMMAALLPLQSALLELRSIAPQAESAQQIILDSKSSSFEPKIASSIENQDRPHSGPFGVDMSSVDYRYRDAPSPTISNFSLRIEPGEYVALVGPSGAGKTTLADLILGLRAPQSGTIRWTFPSGATSGGSQVNLGYLPQAPGIIKGSLYSNITLGSPPHLSDSSAVEAAVIAAELEELIRTLPNGLQTEIGANLHGLSGGQIQRIGIARALYQNPGLLVLDEPTSALDPITEQSISSTIQKLQGKTTLVVIAHRMSTIRFAQRILMIQDGRVHAEGTFDSLRKDNAQFKRFTDLGNFDTNFEPLV